MKINIFQKISNFLFIFFIMLNLLGITDIINTIIGNNFYFTIYLIVLITSFCGLFDLTTKLLTHN